LFPPGTDDADIYSIAFQEIVQLNAQQILQTDPAKRYAIPSFERETTLTSRRLWEAYIMEHFAKRPGSYILLRSEQLVGAALIVIVREELTKSIRSVEATTKKVRITTRRSR
jgi:hypothetical protein